VPFSHSLSHLSRKTDLVSSSVLKPPSRDNVKPRLTRFASAAEGLAIVQDRHARWLTARLEQMDDASFNKLDAGPGLGVEGKAGTAKLRLCMPGGPTCFPLTVRSHLAVSMLSRMYHENAYP